MGLFRCYGLTRNLQGKKNKQLWGSFSVPLCSWKSEVSICLHKHKKYQSLASSLLSVKTKATSLSLHGFPNCSAAWKVNNSTCSTHPLSAHIHIGSLYILIYIERETYMCLTYIIPYSGLCKGWKEHNTWKPWPCTAQVGRGPGQLQQRGDFKRHHSREKQGTALTASPSESTWPWSKLQPTLGSQNRESRAELVWAAPGSLSR